MLLPVFKAEDEIAWVFELVPKLALLSVQVGAHVTSLTAVTNVETVLPTLDTRKLEPLGFVVVIEQSFCKVKLQLHVAVS